MTLIGRKGGQSKPVYDSSADYTASVDFNGSAYFESGGTKYVICFNQSSRNMYVSKNGGAFTTVTNALQSNNTAPNAATVSVATDGTISILVGQYGVATSYVYTYNTSNDTLSFVATRSMQSQNILPRALAFVKNGSELTMWAENVTTNTIYVYDTDEKFATLTYSSTKSFTVSGHFGGMTQVGSIVYLSPVTSGTVVAYNTDRTENTDFNFERNSNNSTTGTVYADENHLFIYDYDDNKFYAYKYFTPYSTVTIPTPQDALKLPVLVYSSASKEIDGTYATVGTDLLADTDGSLIMTFAYDNNGSGQYLPQTVRMLKSRITTTEQRIPVVASVVGGNQSWAYRKAGITSK